MNYNKNIGNIYHKLQKYGWKMNIGSIFGFYLHTSNTKINNLKIL